MAYLLMVQGPGVGRRFVLEDREIIIGRQAGTTIHLDHRDISRRHARITREGEGFFLEDLGSSNGTFLNGLTIKGKVLLRPQNHIRIGPCELIFEDVAVAQPPASPKAESSDADLVIRGELSIQRGNTELYRENAQRKLQAVLDIAHHLAQTHDLDELLPRLLDHLLELFAKADRGLILLRDGERLVVRALRTRRPDFSAPALYSRTVVGRVLAEGIGIVAASTQGDAAPQSLRTAGIHSFVCAPLKGRDGRALGVLQVDRQSRGGEFAADDLHLLTAISLQVSAVLENTVLHAELLEHERVKRDLALARLGQMAAGVAHEINNPLAFVNNNTAIVQRDLDALRKLLNLYEQAGQALAPHRPELLQEIRAFAEEIDLPHTLRGLDDLLGRSRDGLKRIGQIVQGLRTFARLDDSEQDHVDLNAGIEASVTIARGLAQKRQVEIVLELSPLPRLACRPARINQVVFNLLANAIDACADGGRVTVRSLANADNIEIHVLDNGHGIDPAIRDKIFDPFFTTKPLGKGVGLGLSISHGIVQDHGGRIDFQSQPGQGAHFIMRLPRPRQENR